MSIEDLLEQLERYRLRREQRDYRPEWLKSFIRSTAALFEPLSHAGRVGYDCQCDERGWTVCLYLGTTEIVGGARDGQIEHADFRIDLTRLSALFVRLDRFEWYSLAGGYGGSQAERIRSLVTVHGAVEGVSQDTNGNHDVRLELLAIPPDFVGPGLHCRPDGTMYEID
jgi:hypothetical protein